MSPLDGAEELRLRLHLAAVEQHRDQLGAVLAFALAALRALFLLNGGAVVALLAFYGDALTGALAGQIEQAALRDALAWFVGGLVAAFLVCAASYLAQLAYAEGVRLRRARWLRAGALLAAAGSLAAFALGAFAALAVLE